MERTLQLLQEQQKRYEKNYDLVGGEKVADSNLENASVEDINRQIDKLIDEGKRLKSNLAPKLE